MFGKNRFLVLILILSFFVSIFTTAQFQRVGTAPNEDSRSLVFVSVDANTVLALAGMKRYGVFVSSANPAIGTWTTWQPTGLDEFALFDSNTGEPAVVNTVNCFGTRVFAGTSSGKIFWSSDASTLYSNPWIESIGLPDNSVMDIAVASNGEVLAAVKGSGIYLSQDMGETFSLLADRSINNNFMAIALHPDYSPSSRKFWTVTEERDTTSGGIYFYDGSQFSDITPIGFYSFTSIITSPETSGDPEAIWVGDTKGSGVLQSFDLGQTWTSFSNLCDKVLTLTLAPNYSTSNKHIYIGTNVGLYEVISGSAFDIYPKGMAINSLFPDLIFPDFMWFATSSGIRRALPGQSFPEPVQREAISLFDISYLEFSSSFISDSTIFALSQRNGLFISKDGGNFFNFYMPPLERSFSSNLDFEISGFGLSPTYSGTTGSCNSEESTVYLATKGKGVFKSSSNGSDWISINNGISNSDRINSFKVSPNPYEYPLFLSRSNSTSVCRFQGATETWFCTPLIDPTPNVITSIELPQNFPNPPIVYAGTDIGLYISTNGGATFTFDDTFPVPPSEHLYISEIAFHPQFDGVSNQTVFVVRGGSLFKRVFNGGQWEWQLWGQSSFPSYDVQHIAISPNFQSGDQYVAVTLNNPQYPQNNGVWLSSDGGNFFINITHNLPDKYPKTIKFLQTTSELKLFTGLRREKLWFTTAPSFSNWQQSLGWETSPSCVNATLMSSVALPTNCTVLPTPTDIFIGTCKGVYWSNDGGENYRPINQGLVNSVTAQGCVPFDVLSLHIENTLDPIRPVLLAGTNGKGVWYREATEVDLNGLTGWDWSEGNWIQATGIPTNSVVYNFSDERGLPNNKVKAATNMGLYSSQSSLLVPSGVEWTLELNEDVRGVCHGATQGLKSSFPHIPEAPQSGVTWGTTWGTGVKKGTETQNFGSVNPESITWETRNGTGAGTLEEMNNWAIIQLTADSSVLVGGDNKGIFRSPDEGLTLWYPSNGGIENTSLRVRDFVEVESNGDILCAIEGSGTEYNGGIFISADNGYHWACLSAGFDPEEQKISDIVYSSGNPPVYYAGTYDKGTYAGTVTPLDPPVITSIDVSSGSSSGGTVVTITGTNFRCSCPDYYDCTHFGISEAVASFGGIDATTVSCSETELEVITPAHLSGTVSVTVRNPDTRSATVQNAFTYTGSSSATVYVSRNESNNIVITTDPSTPTKVFRGINPQFTGYVKVDEISSGSFEYEDSTGTNSYIYYYKVE